MWLILLPLFTAFLHSYSGFPYISCSISVPSFRYTLIPKNGIGSNKHSNSEYQTE